MPGHERLEVTTDEDGTRGGAVLLGDLGELVADDAAQHDRVAEDLEQRGDGGAQLGELGLELLDLERDQAAQLHVQDVAGLHVGEAEPVHQRRARDGDVGGGADDPDDLVDVGEREQQALDQVRALLGLAQPVARPAGHDVGAVLEEDLEQLLEAERPRLAVDERDVVDAEGLLQRRQAVELAEDGLRVEAGLDLEDQLGAERAVGEVLDVGDALQLLAVDELLHLGDDPLGADAVRQLGDGDGALATGERTDLGGGPHPDDAAAGLVGLPDLLHAEQLPAGRQVGAGKVPHQVVEGRRGLSSRCWAASTTSTRLCGIMLVAMPTAMPDVPLTSRFG